MRSKAGRSYIENRYEWLGDFPDSWDVKPLFSLVEESKEKNRNGTEKNVLSLSYGKIIRRNVDSNFGLLPASFDTYQIVHPGYIVMRLTDLQNDHKSLRVGFVKEKGIITSAYLGLHVTSDEILPEYLYFLLHAYDLKKVFYSMGGGVRQSINFNDVRNIPILLPSLNEQRSIIEKLNRIDERSIEQVKILNETIDSIKEQKNALMHSIALGVN